MKKSRSFLICVQLKPLRSPDEVSDVRFSGRVPFNGLLWSAREHSLKMDSMPKTNSRGRRPKPESPFARNLIRLMEERRMSVREAARIAGVGSSTISSWRAGANPADFMAVLKLARALGVSFSFLLTGVDDSRRNGHPPSLAEVLDQGRVIFNGLAKITIHELIEKKREDSK